jgi:Flp pilus assembly pilin Flp
MFSLSVKAQRLLQSLKDEYGQDSVEYAIMIGITATAVIGSVSTISAYISSTFAGYASLL